MAIQLDHVIVPSHEPVEGAKFLAGLLDVPWEKSRGSFTPVYVNETLTFDFADRKQFESHHFCFRVSDAEFDGILGRIRRRGSSTGAGRAGKTTCRSTRASAGRISTGKTQTLTSGRSSR